MAETDPVAVRLAALELRMDRLEVAVRALRTALVEGDLRGLVVPAPPRVRPSPALDGPESLKVGEPGH